MTRVIAITNQKGGVGKTTTAINLGAALADLGHRTLVIDLDPQAHTTMGLGVDSTSLEKTMSHVLTEETPLRDVLKPTRVERMVVAPGHMDLAFAEEALTKAIGRDLRLKKRLDEVRDEFEYVVLDSPAQLNLLTINTMAAATEVIVPVQSQYYSFVGLGQLLETIRMMQSWVNPTLRIAGVLVTQFDRRSALHARAVERLRRELDGHVPVFQTIIPMGLRVQHAAEAHVPVVHLFRKSPVAVAYQELAAEVVLSA